jgi:glutamine synthetase
MNFAARCGVHDDAREKATHEALRAIQDAGLERVRIAWCDLHGTTRAKTLTASAVAKALHEGVSLVSTLLLKDSSDRTVYKVFEPDGTAGLPGFGQGNNLVLLPDPASLRQLPWAPGTGWMRAQPWFQDGTPVALDTRRQLQQALERLAHAGFGLRCGLEVEFHVYRLANRDGTPACRDPASAGWPGPAPSVELVHPGYRLLGEDLADQSDEPLRIVQHTAKALGLPLQSLEVEFGPSQLEAVFDATEAMVAADNMVLFRNGVRMALARAGYHATFMCRPPFPDVMASGWHLHQSLVGLEDGANAFTRHAPADGSSLLDAAHVLSTAGEAFLAGLLAHARGMVPLCTPTINGYGRFRPNALAPQAIVWGHDNRGAMLRVIGEAGDEATRIENRLGEPAANPYLYIASQVHAGLDGIARALAAPRATEDPYAGDAPRIPTNLGDALDALQGDAAMVEGFGASFIDHFVRIKRQELARFDAAQDPDEFQRREYFGRT